MQSAAEAQVQKALQKWWSLCKRQQGHALKFSFRRGQLQNRSEGMQRRLCSVDMSLGGEAKKSGVEKKAE
eukprot:2921989-Pleurochrysis_carterae.AAC.4